MSLEHFGVVLQVRVWNVARTQDELMAHMRNLEDVQHRHLVAYWKFDDPQE